ncbi:hypothetical protein LINGRAHAP2_LOCUS3945, partial [Linum grandiflorum]
MEIREDIRIEDWGIRDCNRVEQQWELQKTEEAEEIIAADYLACVVDIPELTPCRSKSDKGLLPSDLESGAESEIEEE